LGLIFQLLKPRPGRLCLLLKLLQEPHPVVLGRRGELRGPVILGELRDGHPAGAYELGLPHLPTRVFELLIWGRQYLGRLPSKGAEHLQPDVHELDRNVPPEVVVAQVDADHEPVRFEAVDFRHDLVPNYFVSVKIDVLLELRAQQFTSVI